MYITTIVFTLAAWVVGLVLDANLGSSQFSLFFRVLLPVLTMGLCLLRAINEINRNKDE